MNAAMHSTDWTDAEIKRATLRQSMFMRRGLSIDAAERLVDTCLDRDRAPDWKDMHACIECKHLQGDFNCAATKRIVIQISLFHRCHRFGWQVPRSN